MTWDQLGATVAVVTGVAPAGGSEGVTIQPSLVVTYNEAVYIGSPGGGLQAPHVSLSLPPSVGDLSFRAEAVVPVTDVWALAVRYVPHSILDFGLGASHGNTRPGVVKPIENRQSKI